MVGRTDRNAGYCPINPVTGVSQLIRGAPLPAELSLLEPVLVCPDCRGDLEYWNDALRCQACAIDRPVVDGVPVMTAAAGPGQQAGGPVADADYQEKYVADGRPAQYDEQFVVESHKRARTRREIAILGALLDRAGGVDRLLNLPCGGGRLSRPLAGRAGSLVEADIAMSQVCYARDKGDYGEAERVAWTSASAFALPFADGSFDGVVCARLLHHFSDPDDHRRLLGELARVARRFVIVSFNDARSPKAISRRLRGKSTPYTLLLGSAAAIMAPLGFDLGQAPSVSPWGSRHRYALFERR